MDQKQASHRMNLWISKLKEFDLDFKIEYLPGEQNVIADALSRLEANSIEIWPEFIFNIQNVDFRENLPTDIQARFEKHQDIGEAFTIDQCIS